MGSAVPGRVRTHCCVAVAASRPAPRKGLDRSGGSGLGWVCGARPRFSICAGSTHDSPFSWTVPREGSIVATNWRPGGQGFSLRVDRPARRENPCPPAARVAPCGRKILPSRAQTRTMLRSRRDPVANAASFDPSRTNAESCVTPSRTPKDHPSPDPAAGRGPFGGRVDSRPQRRGRRSKPSRRSAAAARSPASPKAAAARHRAEQRTTMRSQERTRPPDQGSRGLRWCVVAPTGFEPALPP